MTLLDWRIPYLAGILDGEGTISVQSYGRRYVKARNQKEPRYTAAMHITNSNEKLLKWLSELLSEYQIKHCLLKHSEREGYKKTYHISIKGCCQSRKLIEIAIPFLIVKEEQAKSVLAWCNSREIAKAKTRENRGYTSKEHQIIESIRKLNEGKGKLR